MSSEPAFQCEAGFGQKKGKARLAEHFGSNGKKRTAKSVLLEGTGSPEKLCYASYSFIQFLCSNLTIRC